MNALLRERLASTPASATPAIDHRDIPDAFRPSTPGPTRVRPPRAPRTGYIGCRGVSSESACAGSTLVKYSTLVGEPEQRERERGQCAERQRERQPRRRSPDREGQADGEPEMRLDHRAERGDDRRTPAIPPCVIRRQTDAAQRQRHDLAERQRDRAQREREDGERDLPRNSRETRESGDAREPREQQQ